MVIVFSWEGIEGLNGKKVREPCHDRMPVGTGREDRQLSRDQAGNGPMTSHDPGEYP